MDYGHLGTRSGTAEFFRSLFERMRHGFALHEMIFDEAGRAVDYRFLYVNPAFESMTGLHAENLLGRTVLEAIPGIERHWIERYGEVTQTGASMRFEEYSATLGQYYSVFAFSPSHGQFAVIIDNTSHTRTAGDDFSRTDSLQRSLFENHPTAILVIDPTDGRIMDANPAACSYYGWKREEFRKKNIMEINTLTPEEISFAMQHAHTGSHSQYHFRHRLASGENREVEVFAGPIPWEGKMLLCSTVHDITEQKRAEEALSDSEAKYRAIVDQASDGVVVVDPETGLILEGNRRFEELLGYHLPEDGPLSVTQLIVDDPDNTLRLMRQLIETGTASMRRRIFRHRNGVHVPVVRLATMIQYRERKVFTMSFRDISAEMRREQEILRDAASAQRIQEALTKRPASNRYVTIDAMSRPRLYVSGDLYFLDWRFEGRVLRGFLVDTMGHGLGTALHAAAFHVMLREVNETDLPLDSQIKELNRRATRHFDDETFAAAIAFEVDLENRELRWVAAGITEFRVTAGASQRKILTPGMFLGIVEDENYELRTLPLAEGDCFYFCTDGLTDRLNSQAETSRCSWPDMLRRLQELVQEWECRDDATAVSLRIESFPKNMSGEANWPRVLQLNGYGDYRRRRDEIVKIIAELTGLPHSRQEVAVNEALINALECRDGATRQHQARLRINRVGKRLIVRVKTSRIGFAGNAVLLRLRSHPDEMFAFGTDASMGRGIPLMLSLAHQMKYNGEGTELLLAWKL